MDVGKRIENELSKSNMSQRELSNIIGVDESIVSRIVRGDRSPRLEVLANIATALHTTSDYLLGIDNSAVDTSMAIRIIARNSSKMTEKEKKQLLEALFWEE